MSEDREGWANTTTEAGGLRLRISIKVGKVYKSLRILRYRGGLSGRWFALTSCLGGVVAVGLLAMAAGSHHHSPLRAAADVLIGPGGLALAVAAVAVAALRR
jgi:hypothetical protein